MLDHPRKVNFEPTFNLGHVGVVTSIIVAAVANFYILRGDVRVVEEKQRATVDRVLSLEASREANRLATEEFKNTTTKLTTQVESLSDIVKRLDRRVP